LSATATPVSATLPVLVTAKVHCKVSPTVAVTPGAWSASLPLTASSIAIPAWTSPK
jgi:hypothetical protein